MPNQPSTIEQLRHAIEAYGLSVEYSRNGPHVTVLARNEVFCTSRTVLATDDLTVLYDALGSMLSEVQQHV
jgi:hypothetical protein